MNPPNQTLYIKNLPDKVKKADLRTALYMLFATYGVVLDVVAVRTNKMRGQAHVVFRDAATSTQAMRALDGFEFCGREMKITYAKGSSNILAKLNGTYAVPPPAGVSTELQRSIFGGPPTAVGQAVAAATTTGLQGTKRAREEDEGGEKEKGAEEKTEKKEEKEEEEEEESEGEAPMEEDSE